MSRRRTLRNTAANTAQLAHNTAHQFAASHALRIYSANAIYSFIPKNACSTLRLSLAIHNGAIRDVSEANWIHSNNDTFRASLSELCTAEYTFVVLRCPYRRIASVFLDKIVGITSHAWSYHRLTNRSRDPFDVTFKDFVRSLNDPSVLVGNIHWRPQSDFLVYDAYDDYFSLEDFPAVASRLHERIGFEVVDARGITGHGIDTFEPFDDPKAPDLTAFEILSLKRQGKCPRPVALFDDETRSIIKHHYARDIAHYRKRISVDGMLFSD